MMMTQDEPGRVFLRANHMLDSFRPNEDTPDNDCDPRAVLYDTMYFGDVAMHVWAIAVKGDDQEAVNPDYESDLDRARGMIGGHWGGFNTVAYDGYEYVIVAIPHGVG